MESKKVGIMKGNINEENENALDDEHPTPAKKPCIEIDELAQLKFEMISKQIFGEDEDNSADPLDITVNDIEKYDSSTQNETLVLDKKLQCLERISEEDSSIICRLCGFSIVGSRFYLYENVEIPFEQMVNYSLPVHVHIEDGLPDNICEQCKINVEKCYKFACQATIVDKAIRTRFLKDTKPNSSTELSGVDLETSNPIKTSEITTFKRKPAPAHKCTNCKMTFKNFTTFHKHECIASKSTTYKCPTCSKEFPIRARLQFHAQFHLPNPRPLKCEECNINFKTEHSYYDHATSTHKDTVNWAIDAVHMCEICGKRLTHLKYLKQHLTVHHELKAGTVLVCNICNEALASSTAVLAHTSTHLDTDEVFAEEHLVDVVYRCEYCDSSFVSKEKLNEHRTDHCHRTYMCHICKSSFSTFSRCASHKVSHGYYKENYKVEPYPVTKHYLCEVCNKAFLHSIYLNTHIQTKHPVLAYKCAECNVDFPTKWALEFHNKKEHKSSKSPVFSCTKRDCNKEFADFPLLLKHNREEHNSCEICNEDIGTLYELNAHQRAKHKTKTFACPELDCGQQFQTLKLLTTHVTTDHNPPVICVKCNKIFVSTEALESHDNRFHSNYPKACQTCGLMFQSVSGLQSHKALHEDEFSNKTCVLCKKTFMHRQDLQRHTRKSHSGKFRLVMDGTDTNYEENCTPDFFSDEEDMNVANPDACAPSTLSEKKSDIVLLKAGKGNSLIQSPIYKGDHKTNGEKNLPRAVIQDNKVYYVADNSPIAVNKDEKDGDQGVEGGNVID